MEELKTSDYLKGIVLNLPESPGVYQYLNTEGTIIYVGKAKNLKRRVSSYFNREHEPGKTRVLVSKIADIRYIVVNTEEDALLLENNLIKKYKPRYNVLLKDDKTYPSICVQNEYFPRVFKTRRVIRNGSSYYGPYSHIPSMYALLDLIKHLYPLRTCNLNLSPENIRAGKFNVCLEYRSLRWQTKSGRISEQHRRDKRDTQRQHPRGRADAVSANAGSCRRNEV